MIITSYFHFLDFVNIKQPIDLPPRRTVQNDPTYGIGCLVQSTNTSTPTNGGVSFITVPGAQKQPASVRSRRGHVPETD